MNGYIFASLFLTLLTSEGYQAAFTNEAAMSGSVEECIKVTGVEPELAYQAIGEGQFKDDKKVECFVKCLFEKEGCMTTAGQMVAKCLKEDAPYTLSPEKSSSLVDSCLSTVKATTDTCRYAYETLRCLMNGATKLQSS